MYALQYLSPRQETSFLLRLLSMTQTATLAGNTHVNSYTWKPNNNGTTTIHFNCGDDKLNNISSNGAKFNYAVRNYGASQKVIDEAINPIKPLPVN